jgi:thiol-disulfide isomerase/thioredoxin
LLIKDVAGEFGPKVKVVTEEYGNSPMATKFGVRRYPVVFVDEVLVARPKDFGFAGPDDKSPGLYVPWREPANQERFKTDLRRMVERRLKGERVEGLNPDDVRADAEDGPSALPVVGATTLAGQPLKLDALTGKVVVVELWATWCPPCRSTLAWLDELQKRHGDRVSVIAIALDSPEADVRRMVAELKPSYEVVIGTPELLAPFGAVAAVPKMFVFDRAGKRAQVFYGSPPDQHEKVEKAVAALIQGGEARSALKVQDLDLHRVKAEAVRQGSGGVGLWIGAGTEAFFSGLRINASG